jgi:hypothetical protein
MSADRTTRDWRVLLASLDFQNGHWFEFDTGTGEGVWKQVAFFRVHDVMLDLGFGDPVKWVTVRDGFGNERSEVVPDEERDAIIKHFVHRDREATKRTHIDAERMGKVGRGKVRRSAAEEHAQRRTEHDAQLGLEY